MPWFISFFFGNVRRMKGQLLTFRAMFLKGRYWRRWTSERYFHWKTEKWLIWCYTLGIFRCVCLSSQHMSISKLRAWKNTRFLTVPYHETWILLHCTHIEVVNILFPIIFIQQIIFPKDSSFHKRNYTIPRIHCPHSTFHSYEWQSSAKTRTELGPSAIQVLSHVKLKHPTKTTALVPDADLGIVLGETCHDMPSNNIGESHVYYIYYTYLRNQHPN